jgi:hypothetical protein
MPTKVYLEVGKSKTFACALDWPGWARAGRTEEAALSALADYVARYAEVAKEAVVRLPKSAAEEFEVVERVPGTATTDFGAPGEVPAADAQPLTGAAARRLAKLVRAAWAVFDRVAAQSPAGLRKGPRGGGRDRDKMIGHVIDAEASYARKLGVKLKPPAIDDAAAIAAMRDEIAAVLALASDGSPLADKGWPTRYAARRIAWHVLDHAWEMQDRAD